MGVGDRGGIQIACCEADKAVLNTIPRELVLTTVKAFIGSNNSNLGFPVE